MSVPSGVLWVGVHDLPVEQRGPVHHAHTCQVAMRSLNLLVAVRSYALISAGMCVWLHPLVLGEDRAMQDADTSWRAWHMLRCTCPIK